MYEAVTQAIVEIMMVAVVVGAFIRLAEQLWD